MGDTEGNASSSGATPAMAPHPSAAHDDDADSAGMPRVSSDVVLAVPQLPLPQPTTTEGGPVLTEGVMAPASSKEVSPKVALFLADTHSPTTMSFGPRQKETTQAGWWCGGGGGGGGGGVVWTPSWQLGKATLEPLTHPLTSHPCGALPPARRK